MIVQRDSGDEACSFTLRPGVDMTPDNDAIILQYVSDEIEQSSDASQKKNQRFDIVSQRIRGDKATSLEPSLQFITHVSEQSTAVEQQMRNDDLTKLRPTMMTLVEPA